MIDGRGWATLFIDHDQMTPGTVIHVVPVEASDDLTPVNGHELHALCWCHPVRIGSLFDDVMLSHREPSWPGANTDSEMIVH